MAQTITTNDWTEITGLDSSKTYVLQAQYTSEYGGGNGVFGAKPIPVMWLQAGSAPQSTDVGAISEGIKVNASTAIYVKTQVKPVTIVVQEVA